MMDRIELITQLKQIEYLSERLGIKCPPLYVIGGAAGILNNKLSRTTDDLDFIDMDYPAKIGRLLRHIEKYDFVEKEYIPLHPEYKKRATRMNEITKIPVYILSPEDIVLLKLARLTDIDLIDIKELLKGTDIDSIDSLVREVLLINQNQGLKNRVLENYIKLKEVV